MEHKIRPLYGALQGFLLQAPTGYHYLYDSTIWDQFHNVIKKLNEISGNNYDDFKLTIQSDQSGEARTTVTEYRSKLNGIIMHLHGEYFYKENSPFGGPPISGSSGVVVNQSQNQSQSVQLIIALELQTLIDKQLYAGKLDEKEKTFLETIKKSLSTVKSLSELLGLIITTAASMGFSVEQIKHILGF
jgi:hypothetical protein